MKKFWNKSLVILGFVCVAFSANAQQDSLMASARVNNLPTFNVAIFAPLYLDSIFENGVYKYGKNFPKFATPGLEFVNGAQIALDSMKVYKGNIRATFFDSKSSFNPINSLVDSKRLDSFHLIIGSVKDEDYQQLAAFSAMKNIPFVSATYPNDGGVKNNPFLILLNSTLRAHCEAIFANLMQNNSKDNIIFLTRNGNQENVVMNYFNDINTQDGGKILHYRIINMDESDAANKIAAYTDSLKSNIFVGASLNSSFATKVFQTLNSIDKKTKITLIGMPNWEAFASTAKKINKDLIYYFTSPYFNYKTNSFAVLIDKVYKKKYNTSPSETAFKGFETTFLFSRLLTRFPDDYMNHLNDYAYKVFNEFNFLPVYLNRQPKGIPDYFENKRLYMLKVQNGVTTKSW